MENIIPRQEDPMDQFSHPTDKKDYKLGTLFYMTPRRNPAKPGRELVVNFDDRFPIIPSFKAHYSYYVRFLEDGNSAGNHYHQKKKELFIPICGSFTVTLEDIDTKERVQLDLRSAEGAVFFVPSLISHRVTAKKAGAVLLVIATSPNTDDDEFHYEMA
ncbi:MAG: WxcM-like domain-containing protein [Patescibacteria group bacterium]|nr:WxcM-like domain-containing protein [Patescibacteria group bacterium]